MKTKWMIPKWHKKGAKLHTQSTNCLQSELNASHDQDSMTFTKPKYCRLYSGGPWINRSTSERENLDRIRPTGMRRFAPFGESCSQWRPALTRISAMDSNFMKSSFKGWIINKWKALNLKSKVSNYFKIGILYFIVVQLYTPGHKDIVSNVVHMNGGIEMRCPTIFIERICFSSPWNTRRIVTWWRDRCMMSGCGLVVVWV